MIQNFGNERQFFTTKARYRTAECILTWTRVSTIRANVTNILARTHTPTQYSYVSLLLHKKNALPLETEC